MKNEILKKRCPLMGNVCCIEEICAWYSKTYEECAVLLNAESTTDISTSEDDEGIKVIINGD